MNSETLDAWWASLTMFQKERIASKAVSKSEGKEVRISYPACTEWWVSTSPEVRQRVYEHCTDKHGLLLEEWRDGKTYSY